MNKGNTEDVEVHEGRKLIEEKWKKTIKEKYGKKQMKLSNTEDG